MPAFTLQVRDVKNSLAIKSAAGLCSGSDEFMATLNEVVSRLLDRGGWWNTEFKMRLCIYNSCITWPGIVGTVNGVRSACTDHQIRNNWYDILGPLDCAWSCDRTISDSGTAATYNDISGTDGKYIRIYPTKLEDVGKTVTIFGIGPDSQPLQQKINGVWQRGVTLTLAVPFVQSAVLVQRIDSVVKEVTQANVLAYEYESSTGYQRDIALWEPTETNPQYRRSKVHGYCSIPTGCSEEDGIVRKTIEALVKLNFRDLVNDEDFVPIGNLYALKQGFQAIRLEEANQDAAAGQKWLSAVDQLNMELRDKLPGPQTTVRVNMTGRMITSPM